MDVWSVGLVLFNLVYGVDLINDALKFQNRCAQSSELMKTQIMHDILVEELPKFKAAMTSDKKPSGDLTGQEGWEHLWDKIKENPKMWEQVIEPMLNADPNARATWAQSLDAFNGLCPLSAE